MTSNQMHELQMEHLLRSQAMDREAEMFELRRKFDRSDWPDVIE